MRAVRFHETGGPDVLGLEEIDRPSPGSDELLAGVEAAAINPAEAYVRSDWEEYPPHHLPMIPGADFAGVVEAVGDDVTGFEVGDRVFAAVSHSQEGGLAEYIAIPAAACVSLPDGVAFEQGAGLGTAGAIAWHALANKPRLEPGKTCLVQGASGGVGHLAAQIASAAGMRVIATAGSADRCDRLVEFGVDVALDYRRDDLQAAIETAAPAGVDIVLEHLPDEYLDMDVAVCAEDGHIVIFGGTEMATTSVHPGRSNNVTIWLTSSGAYSKAESLRKLGRLLDSGDVRVEIARRYPLEETAAAYRALETESVVGRIIVEP